MKIKINFKFREPRRKVWCLQAINPYTGEIIAECELTNHDAAIREWIRYERRYPTCETIYIGYSQRGKLIKRLFYIEHPSLFEQNYLEMKSKYMEAHNG